PHPSQTCYSLPIAGLRYTSSPRVRMHAMNEAPTPRASRVKDGYTAGARTLASRSVKSLARTRITPNALTAAGVTLCLTAAVLVPFESRDKLLFYWLGASVFVVGSVLDIL